MIGASGLSNDNSGKNDRLKWNQSGSEIKGCEQRLNL
jgi:hypothetical protein